LIESLFASAVAKADGWAGAPKGRDIKAQGKSRLAGRRPGYAITKNKSAQKGPDTKTVALRFSIAASAGNVCARLSSPM